jgi:hypothetical protein
VVLYATAAAAAAAIVHCNCNHYREKNDEVERSVRRERRAMQVKDVDRAIYTEVMIACTAFS